eukprot:TRINITY_DN4217_c0_g1_i1.p1 TRINITY_DN4217_c0_g1~~TRINITY_DN4217_c0_g1_i1.p1  ORF type:complete len:511 (+),score=59.29 TRINITY_DN4217_c0_g1_i1:191-1534(+)
MISFTQAQADAVLSGNVSAHSVHTVRTEMHTAEGGQVLTVTLQHKNSSAKIFQAVRHSIYGKDAKARVGNGTVKIGSPRTFRGREHGRWVSMTLHNDGLIHGLFQDEHRILQVTPAVQHKHDPQVANLLELYKGQDALHVVQLLNLTILREHLANSFSNSKDPVSPENEAVHVPEDVSGDGARSEALAANAAGTSSTGSAAAANWHGTRWFGGGACYPGDDHLHELLVGIYADFASHRYAGSALQGTLESIVNEASFVFEMQMNIILKIGDLGIETDPSTPDFGSCPSTDDMVSRLDAMKGALARSAKPPMAASHLFTACGYRGGIVGLAFMGTLCRSRGGYNSGTTKIHFRSPWLTFVHELGHNLAGTHSWEEGRGRTGGVMDYGDGKLDGVYQFNTKYRKRQVCRLLSFKVNSCYGKFQRDPAVTTTTTTTTTATTTTTTTSTTA